MCTVVVRRHTGRPVQLLALRDELVGREFDDPGRWWPDQPTVVGGRDRVAGGSWAVTEVTTGASALVLNRPERRLAETGAPSRGVLPLLAVRHGGDWPGQLDLSGMASFTLVLAEPARLRLWVFDGERLTSSEPEEGTTMVTSGGAEDGKADRHLARFVAGSFPDGWRALVQAQPPADDLAALVVRHELGDRVFATVFGQLLEAVPGRLRLRSSRTPWVPGSWVDGDWS
ncbi:MAG: NRDE family protein [Mycobacteriales bacterium]